jgi:CDP-paratose 2-epimerase
LEVRDLLYVDDLVDALLLARRDIGRLSGQAFNIGGGAERAASLLQVIAQLQRLHGGCEIEFEDWRPSDQRYYVSNTRRFERATGWRPRVSVEQGIAALYGWLSQTRQGEQRSSFVRQHESGQEPGIARAGHEQS